MCERGELGLDSVDVDQKYFSVALKTELTAHAWKLLIMSYACNPWQDIKLEHRATHNTNAR